MRSSPENKPSSGSVTKATVNQGHLLQGSKSSREDFLTLRAQGWMLQLQGWGWGRPHPCLQAALAYCHANSWQVLKWKMKISMHCSQADEMSSECEQPWDCPLCSQSPQWKVMQLEMTHRGATEMPISPSTLSHPKRCLFQLSVCIIISSSCV